MEIINNLSRPSRTCDEAGADEESFHYFVFLLLDFRDVSFCVRQALYITIRLFEQGFWKCVFFFLFFFSECRL